MIDLDQYPIDIRQAWETGEITLQEIKGKCHRHFPNFEALKFFAESLTPSREYQNAIIDNLTNRPSPYRVSISPELIKLMQIFSLDNS